MLAKKFASLYYLLEDLLSPQKHYDWGLRAIKSVLVVAGSLLRAEEGQVESHVLFRALRDFNIPKILAQVSAAYVIIYCTLSQIMQYRLMSQIVHLHWLYQWPKATQKVLYPWSHKLVIELVGASYCTANYIGLTSLHADLLISPSNIQYSFLAWEAMSADEGCSFSSFEHSNGHHETKGASLLMATS
jgi:hypothetical protein